MGIVDQEQPFSDKAMRVALIMLAFVIPPLGFMTNFVVLASALYVATYLILRKILSDGGSVALIVGAAIILISCGLTRVQGTVFSLAIASAFAISAYSSKLHRAKPATIMALLSSALVPVAIIGCIFKVVANDPLAFQKIQIAWGRVLSMPWKPIIEGFQSGAAVNFGNGTEFPFTIVRIALFVALAVVALLYWAKEIYNRQNHRSLVIFDGFALLIGLGLIALPLMTSTLMSTHRYMTCSAIIVAAALKLGWRPSWLLISLLLLLRMGEFALFFRGYPFLVW
jgi:hypothetical protein